MIYVEIDSYLPDTFSVKRHVRLSKAINERRNKHTFFACDVTLVIAFRFDKTRRIHAPIKKQAPIASLRSFAESSLDILIGTDSKSVPDRYQFFIEIVSRLKMPRIRLY